MEAAYNQQIETALLHRVTLSKKYKVEVSHYDKTALVVYCTDKEHTLICKQLKCSGIYSEILNAGIITNFGVYN